MNWLGLTNNYCNTTRKCPLSSPCTVSMWDLAQELIFHFFSSPASSTTPCWTQGITMPWHLTTADEYFLMERMMPLMWIKSLYYIRQKIAIMETWRHNSNHKSPSLLHPKLKQVIILKSSCFLHKKQEKKKQEQNTFKPSLNTSYIGNNPFLLKHHEEQNIQYLSILQYEIDHLE